MWLKEERYVEAAEKFENSPNFLQSFPDIKVFALDYSSDGRFFAVGGYDSKLAQVYNFCETPVVCD
eukprot:TRINITY_DN3211_c1_g11_i1.p2 TRINITY_DN3211_c1_g11~~TRINITY_DN3211_c1_g11_i1.p2  ORF type:complete len:66 (-),score=22.83 TRINITY_DN3211_c1_g11_i1:283-480(-)